MLPEKLPVQNRLSHLEPPRETFDFAVSDYEMKCYLQELGGEFPRGGQILSAYHAVILASALLLDPRLEKAEIRAMNFELPSERDRQGVKFPDPIHSINLLFSAAVHASRKGNPVEFYLDSFANYYGDGKFSWKAFNRRNNGESLYPHRTYPFNGYNRNIRTKIADNFQAEINVNSVLRGIVNGNLHQILDGLPRAPLNALRWHDHRKFMIFSFKDNDPLALFNTFNLDEPRQHNLSLVIHDYDLIMQLKHLGITSPQSNNIIRGNNWILYQDGVLDLDPSKPPEEVSVILDRVVQLLQDPESKRIIWTSQFLPDTKDLVLIEKRLLEDLEFQIEIFAPKPEDWSFFYKHSGGNKAKQLAAKLAKKYPDRFKVVYTDRYQHSKSIMVNNQLVLISTHNFNRSLTLGRTAEMMLELQPGEVFNLESYVAFIQTLRADQYNLT